MEKDKQKERGRIGDRYRGCEKEVKGQEEEVRQIWREMVKQLYLWRAVSQSESEGWDGGWWDVHQSEGLVVKIEGKKKKKKEKEKRDKKNAR